MQDGWTLLHFAAHGGSIQLVDWLIKELGFDVQKVTKVRWTSALSVSRGLVKSLTMHLTYSIYMNVFRMAMHVS